MSNQLVSDLVGFDWRRPSHAYCFLGPQILWVASFEYVAFKLEIPLTNQYRAIDVPRISLNLVKDVERFIRYRPYQGNRSLIGINGNQFSKEAANALLKTFEEPPSGTIIILYTISTENIIPTLLSRSQIVRLPNQATTDLVDTLSEKLPTLTQCTDWSLKARFVFVEKYLHDQGDQTPDWLLDFWLRDMYANGSHFENPKLVNLILEAKKQLAANAQARLILENIMIHIDK